MSPGKDVSEGQGAAAKSGHNVLNCPNEFQNDSTSVLKEAAGVHINKLQTVMAKMSLLCFRQSVVHNCCQ